MTTERSNLYSNELHTVIFNGMKRIYWSTIFSYYNTTVYCNGLCFDMTKTPDSSTMIIRKDGKIIATIESDIHLTITTDMSSYNDYYLTPEQIRDLHYMITTDI